MGHSSHLAEKILEEASKKFELKDFGVEGFCNSVGTKGVSYLNYGDPYDATICVLSNGTKARFVYAGGGWATYAGARSPTGDSRSTVRGEDGFIYKTS